ncbi:Dolichyl-diphosphooligosaccharide--protein glycosyltransferase subunit 1 [Rhynchospora pubera]|uniref:Dolichyl-diphosphooligosaccharide--protein glycosyltransferase subunit 1 n=1 Tax=Rhynchospora pubera TaxID=906938 RepID=A0AAV8EHB6_9POAL|nr:Dolichyl-diphosphooligosaccharide--protein glycosyltransferase subunit 1 [Rhynchospora pubera]
MICFRLQQIFSYHEREREGFRAFAVSLSIDSNSTFTPIDHRSDGMDRRLQFAFVLLCLGLLSSTARSDLVVSKAERLVDLNSHIVRVLSKLKVENEGPDDVSEVLLALPDAQAKNLAAIRTFYSDGKLGFVLPTEPIEPKGMPSDVTYYSIALPKKLGKGKTVSLDVLSIFTRSLKPFPEEITQAESQLVVYTDNMYYTSPYPVKYQSLVFRLPGRVESYTKYPKVELVKSELRYGPFEMQPAFSYSPVVVHFENNNPFAVANELVREIEISHWGNVRVTEQYTISHGGASLKNGFSRIEYQARPYMRGASSFRVLIAKLPARAHSVYYRDEIGNISTSHLWGDSQRTQLEIEPRFPIFGGWKTTFTIGYSLPLHDFLFEADGGKRVLNMTFGCPLDEVLVEKHIVKVVLPEGSKDITVATLFPTKQSEDVKYSHLDILGRPVVVLEKDNVVPEHNLYFQVYYKFNNISLLSEPMMLIVGIFLLFVACIVYMHTDLAISKTSSSYLEKLQWEEVQATVQHIKNIFDQYLAAHDKLESSLRDLSRSGDVQSCKAARKAADAQFKELAKELKPLLTFLQSCSQASSILPKIEELVTKEKEMQEKEMAKHTTVVDCFEKKLGGKDIESRIASQQQKLTSLKQEVESLLDSISEI